MNNWDRGDGFWDLVMRIKEAMERSMAARVAVYLTIFFVGLGCILSGVLGQADAGWIVIGGICWLALVIDIIANYLRNSGYF